MMGGLPVVLAFNAPDTLVREYGCGYQVDPADQESVIDAIRKIRDLSDNERMIMGEKGRNAIMDRFTYAKLAEQFIDNIK